MNDNQYRVNLLIRRKKIQAIHLNFNSNHVRIRALFDSPDVKMIFANNDSHVNMTGPHHLGQTGNHNFNLHMMTTALDRTTDGTIVNTNALHTTLNNHNNNNNNFQVDNLPPHPDTTHTNTVTTTEATEATTIHLTGETPTDPFLIETKMSISVGPPRVIQIVFNNV